VTASEHPPQPELPWIARWRTEVSADGYTLKGYDALRCIFVGIPKTASQSIALSLFGNLGGGHTDARRYRRVFGSDFDRYFKFTFVRNPWDRLVSTYFFLKNGGITPRAKAWSETHLSAFDSFASFVEAWVTADNVAGWRNFRPQHAYVASGDGTLVVDYVGRFERLAQDVSTVCGRLGVDATLLHENATRGREADYRSYYTDAMAEAVGQVYARDVELFGYRFDRPAPHSRDSGALA
jgi:ligand-binding SRPBCC domain-containing protein